VVPAKRPQGSTLRVRGTQRLYGACATSASRVAGWCRQVRSGTACFVCVQCYEMLPKSQVACTPTMDWIGSVCARGRARSGCRETHPMWAFCAQHSLPQFNSSSISSRLAVQAITAVSYRLPFLLWPAAASAAASAAANPRKRPSRGRRHSLRQLP
jgi:hypothetical protein